MANYTLTCAVFRDGEGFVVVNLSPDPINLVGGDTVTFYVQISGSNTTGATVDFTGLSIFTNNTAITNIPNGGGTTRTVAAGGTASNTITATASIGTSPFNFDTSSINRQAVLPDLSTSSAGGTLPYGSTSNVTVLITGVNTTAGAEAYSVCPTNHGSGPGINVAVVGDRISGVAGYSNASGQFYFTIPNADCPTDAEGSKTYFIYSYRYTAYNGDGEYYLSGSFTVSRVLTAPTDLSFVTASNISPTPSVTVTASGGAGGTLQVSENNSTWVANSSSFTKTRGSTYTFYARRIYNSTTSSVYSESYTVPYTPPDRFINTISDVTISAGSTSSVNLPITNGATSTIYAVFDGATELDTVGGASTGTSYLTIVNASLPSANSSKTYNLYARQPVSNGGNNQYYALNGANSAVIVTRQNYIAPANATCANQQIAYNYSGSLVVNVINASFSTDAYRLCRTGGTKTFSQIVADQIGSTITPSNGRTTFTIIEAELPSQGATEDYTIYAYRYPGFDGQGVYVEAGTFTVERLAQGDVLTNFVPALSSYTEGSGTQTVTFTFTITNPSQSTYYWQIVRDSGINEGEFSSATAGSVTTSSPSFSVTIANNTTDETGSQGETFHAELFFDSGRTQQVGADSSQFTIFDNDLAFAIGTISPSSTLAYDYGYPDPVTVQVTNNGQSGLQPNSRIYNVTKGVVAYAIVDLPNPGFTETYTLNLSNDNALPNAGTTNTYRLDVWNGQALIAGPTFTISRAGADTTPNAFDLGGPVSSAEISINYFSNVITVAGLSTGVSTSISISGTGSPAYSKNGGGYTSSSGTVVNGDTVQVRVTSSANSSTSVSGTLNIGGVTDSFTVVTAASGGSGGNINQGASVDYGIEIYGPDGATTVLSPTTRYGTVIADSGNVTINAGSSYFLAADIAGLTAANSAAVILANVVTAIFDITPSYSGTTGYTIDNNGSVAYTIRILAVRY